MGVYIKDMEMPKSCGECPLMEYDEETGCYCYLTNQYASRTRPDDCPLIKVPPHGRLIDADAFSAKIIEIIEAQGYDDFYTQSIPVGEVLREVVHELCGMGIDGYTNAPTIIPADPAEDGEI